MSDERPVPQVIRRGGFLTGATVLDDVLIRELPAGVPLKAKITQPRRSNPQNRLYRSLLAVVCENLDQPIHSDDLHVWMKIKLGLTTPIKQRNGDVVWVPKSVAFDKMEHAEFTAYFERVKALVTEHLIPGLKSEALEREARAMLGEDA